MKDLSIIYTAYNEYLRSHFNYEGSLFDLLAHEIPKSDMIRHSRIWIDGFNGMAPQKINIVSALIHTAEEVTMTLQMDRPEDAAENTTFLRPYKLYEDLSLRERHSDFTTLTEKSASILPAFLRWMNPSLPDALFPARFPRRKRAP